MCGLLKRDGQIALQKVAALEARVAHLEAREAYLEAKLDTCEQRMDDALRSLQESLHAHTNAVNEQFLKWHVARMKERG